MGNLLNNLVWLEVNNKVNMQQVLQWQSWIFLLQVFQPYAKWWLGPLLQLVVSGDNGGEGIHYMVVEIVVTLLSWTNVATPKVRNVFDYNKTAIYTYALPFLPLPSLLFSTYILTLCQSLLDKQWLR